ncbi:MAG TPA: NAD(P)H-binding protein [Stellaceae bacterium]|nr:NAD(P)H-binding protein [Stellaceae bacterium]
MGVKYLVTGASGRTSMKIIDILLERGVPASDLILVSRSPERAEVARYGARGATLRYGDFTDLASLPQAFAGGEKMYFMPMNHPPDEVDEVAVKTEVARIAKEAGIRYCVYQSFIGAGVVESCEDDFQTENALRASGMDWVILRTGIFAESLGREAKRYIREGKIETHDPDRRRSYITRDDIAAAGAAVLLGEGHAGKIYYIFGSTLSLRELGAELGKIAGKSIEIVKSDKPAWGGMGGQNAPRNDLPALIGRPGQTVFEQFEENARELLTGVPLTSDYKFGFQWHARGMERRPDDLGFTMHRLFKAARAGDAKAAAEFKALRDANPARHALWREIHPEWFA